MAGNPIGFGTPPEETAAVFVRVPVAEAERLDRVASQLRRPKREIVTALLSVVDAEAGRLVLGHHDFHPNQPPRDLEVLTAEQAAALLQVDARTVAGLASRGELPGRKIGRKWRFSRQAILEWLASAETA